MRTRSGTEKLQCPERFAQACIEHSNTIAVKFGNTALNYDELDARSDELAAALEKSGACAGDLIGISMARSQGLLVSILGIWKSGAAFVPFDPDYPKIRMAQMLEDALPTLVLTDQPGQQSLDFPNTRFLAFDDAVTGRTTPFTPVPVTAENPAYVIFTSGSTGRPKGVQVSHGALSDFMDSIQQTLNVRSSDVIAAVTPLSFDISLLELILPLQHGAAVAIIDKTTAGDGRKLGAELVKHQPTIVQATPITWRLLLDGGWKGSQDLTVICGGETLQRSLAEELLAICPRFFNAYGPTEATIWTTLEAVQSGDGPVPIGRAISGYQTLVLGDALMPVPQGTTGQLYIGGIGLASGYVNRPKETARCFVSLNGRGRFYATGDLVRERKDGKLEFMGRADHQVKIHGHRVELADIEAQLLALPGVNQALAMLREDTPGVQKLVAYVVVDHAKGVTAGLLRTELKDRLPNHMIPHHFVEMLQFPTTPSNKVDRLRFPAPNVAIRNGAVTARDPFEAYLQSVWSEVLGIPAIGTSDDFFDLGGDSIQAARITNRIEEWLGELVWPVILFDSPTINELADYLRKTYPNALAKKALGRDPAANGTKDRLVDEKLAQDFATAIPLLPPFPIRTPKNPPAIFVLTPPRSGSTLLRVMLAGSPQLFAPPEIELITFNTMDDRAETFSGRESYRLEGTIRAVMELKDCDATEARRLLESYEENRTSVHDFYGILQSWLGGRRLVDKTPANTLDPQALRRIETSFDNPIYVHLTRHPLGVIRSFLEAKLAEVFFRRVKHEFSPRELAELIWLTSHRNTVAALAEVPSERQYRIAYEDLTLAPEANMRNLCEFLKIGFHPAMLAPWKNKKEKMTDGLHDESKMMGDPKFHTHKTIDSRVADRWRSEMKGSRLGDITRQLAEELGYSDFGDEDDAREEFVL